MSKIKKELKTNKIKNIETISKTINKSLTHNGFPKPKKVLCSKCKKTEFYIKFVISRLAYSQKNNWGYWCEDESKRDQEWCSQCLRQIFYEDKETYWKEVRSPRRRNLFRVYLHDGDI